MAILEVLPDSDPSLRKTSTKVKRVDSELAWLIHAMYEAMVENWGIGLAAVQVGVNKRLFVYEIPDREKKYSGCPKKDAGSGEAEGSDEQPDEDEDEVDPGYTGNFTVCINPRIIAREGAFIDDEGCLSRAGWLAKVERAIKITFEACDLNMVKFERTVEGLEARCIQHEIDHLDGILFTDRAVPGSLREVAEEEESKSVEGEEPAEAEPVKEQIENAS
jgi:peptide deformylase